MASKEEMRVSRTGNSSGGARTGRDASSFLLRVWVESSESEAEGVVFRGYLRDLRTGEEQYFGDPAALVEQLNRQIEDEVRAGTEGADAGAEGPQWSTTPTNRPFQIRPDDFMTFRL